MPFSLDNSQGNAMRDSYRDKEFAGRSNAPTPKQPSVTAVTLETISMLEKTCAKLNAIHERIAGPVVRPDPAGLAGSGGRPGEPTLLDHSIRAAQLSNEIASLVSQLAHKLL